MAISILKSNQHQMAPIKTIGSAKVTLSTNLSMKAQENLRREVPPTSGKRVTRPKSKNQHSLQAIHNETSLSKEKHMHNKLFQ